MSNIELSVQELSEKTGKTIQSIYKRIKNKNDLIQGYLKRDENGNITEPVKIYASVIEGIYNKKPNNDNKLNSKLNSTLFSSVHTSNEESIVYIKTIEILQTELNQLKIQLQEQLNLQKEEMREKNKIIESLSERLAESQQMINQQQQLSMIDKKKILELEERTPLKEDKKRKKFLGIF